MAVLSNVTGFIAESVKVNESGEYKGKAYDSSIKAFWKNDYGQIEGFLIIKNPDVKELKEGTRFIVEAKKTYVRKDGALVTGEFSVKNLHVLQLDMKKHGDDFEITFD